MARPSSRPKSKSPHVMLKNWRESAGLSQAEMARQAHVSPATWCDLEAGKKLPGLSLAWDIEELTKGVVKVKLWQDLDRARRTARKNGSAA